MLTLRFPWQTNIELYCSSAATKAGMEDDESSLVIATPMKEIK